MAVASRLASREDDRLQYRLLPLASTQDFEIPS
jgi:hypothetical protein